MTTPQWLTKLELENTSKNLELEIKFFININNDGVCFVRFIKIINGIYDSPIRINNKHSHKYFSNYEEACDWLEKKLEAFCKRNIKYIVHVRNF